MKNKKPFIHLNRRGSVLVLAVVIVLVLAMLGIGLIKLGLNARLQSVKATLKVSARSAADAGMEHGVARLVSKWDGLTFKNVSEIESYVASIDPTSYQFVDGDDSTDTFGAAKFTYYLETIDSEDKEHEFEVAKLISVGSAAGVDRAVSAKLWLGTEFKAIGVERGIIIKNSGLLFVIPSTAEFTIQTNSDESPLGVGSEGVVLMNGLCIPGEIVIGPGGDTDEVVIEKKDVNIEEGARTAEDLMKFTTHGPPPLDAKDFLVDPNDSDIFYIIEDGMYPPILLDSGQTLEIRGNNGIDGDGFPVPLEIHIAGEILLKGDTGILITVTDEYSSAAEIYVDGDILVMTNASIEYERADEEKIFYGDLPPLCGSCSCGYGSYPEEYENYLIRAAKSLTIYGMDTCTSIEFNNGADLYALVSAPFADIRMKNDGDFYGAVVASNSFTMDNSSAFFFIASLFDFPPIEILSIGIKPGSWIDE